MVRLAGKPTRWRKRKDFDLGFDGTHLAVLAGDALDVYDIRTGRRLRTWPHPPSDPNARGLVDVHSGVVTYLVRTSIELRRVSDGKTASFRPGSELKGCGDPDVWAQIEQTGLFYSLSASQCTYDGTYRLRFIPFREVLRKFR